MPSSAPFVIAIANQKGGVGKTTTALNLGAALALNGSEVVILDLDPQGNASTGLDIRRADRVPGAYTWIVDGCHVDKCVRHTAIDGLQIIPSETDLAGMESEGAIKHRREYQVYNAVKSLDRNAVLLIDCPPSLGLLTLNGLVAAATVLVPLQCEFFALEGLSQLTLTIDRVRERLNPQIHIGGILLTMYDRRNRLSDLIASDARSFFGDRVYKQVIPRNVRVSEAQSFGTPVVMYDQKSPGAQAYTLFAREFCNRHGLALKSRLAT